MLYMKLAYHGKLGGLITYRSQDQAVGLDWENATDMSVAEISALVGANAQVPEEVFEAIEKAVHSGLMDYRFVRCDAQAVEYDGWVIQYYTDIISVE